MPEHVSDALDVVYGVLKRQGRIYGIIKSAYTEGWYDGAICVSGQRMTDMHDTMLLEYWLGSDARTHGNRHSRGEIMINQLVDYEFRAAHLPEPPPIYRYDQGDARYYARVTDGEPPTVSWFPSVTTVIRETSPLPPHLLKWYADKGMDEATAIRDEAAEYGTTFHIYAASLLAGKAIPGAEFQVMEPRLQRDLMALMQFVRDREVEPIAVEMLMASDTLGIAGTIDLVCRMNWKKGRVMAVVDLKTSSGFYRAHKQQIELYRQMWNETYGSYEHAEPMARELGLPSVKPYFAAHTFLWRPKDWRTEPNYDLKEVEGEVPYDEVVNMCNLYRSRYPDWRPRNSVRMQVPSEVTANGQMPTFTTEDPELIILEKWEANR